MICKFFLFKSNGLEAKGFSMKNRLCFNRPKSDFDFTWPARDMLADCAVFNYGWCLAQFWRDPVLSQLLKGFWALPGGFIRPTETVEDCARRELMEETGLETRALLPIGSFSAPGRDPRGWILSNAFLSVVESRSSEVRSGDDAAAAVWCAIRFDHDARDGKSLLVLAPEDGAAPFGVALKVEKDDVGRPVFSADGVNGSLAFDHAAILAAALGRLRTDYAVRELAFAFLPETFTLAELHDVFRLFGIADDHNAHLAHNPQGNYLPFVKEFA